MSLCDPLHHVQDLDRSTPEFPGKLACFIDGQGYKDLVGGLQHDESTRIIEFFDTVGFLLPRPTPPHPTSHRRSIPSTPPTQRTGNASKNSGGCAAYGKSYHSPARFPTLPRSPPNGRSCQEDLATYTADSLEIQGTLSSGYEYTLMTNQGRPYACVVGRTALSRSCLTEFVGFLQGGCRMETLGPSKYRSPLGSHNLPLSIYYGLDGRRRAIRIHQRTSVRLQTGSRTSLRCSNERKVF